MEELIPDAPIELNRLGLIWVYFRRGWGIFFTFVLVAITASGVAWDIVLPMLVAIPWLSWLSIIFPNYGMFCLIGGGGVITFAVVLGWKDFTSKKGSWRAETAVNFKNNPEWVEMRAELKEVKADNREMKAELAEIRMMFATYLITRNVDGGNSNG